MRTQVRTNKQVVKKVRPTVRLDTHRQITIPKRLHDALRLAPGTRPEIELYEGRGLLVMPMENVKRHPAIDKRLREAEKDVRAGRMSGPFKTVAELRQHLQSIKK